jgi:hypothetical protein
MVLIQSLLGFIAAVVWLIWWELRDIRKHLKGD